MRDDEPGNEAAKEPDPRGEEDSECGHAGPEKDESNGNGSPTDDYAEDGEEPG